MHPNQCLRYNLALPTSSRRFANPLSLRLERIPEYAVFGAAQREEIDKIRIRLLDEIADSTQIDRDRSWNAKREALEIIFRCLVRRDGKPRLLHIGAARGVAWRDSPPGRRSRKSTAPAGLADRAADSRVASRCGLVAAHAAQIDFHCWLQWLMEEQLAVAQQAAQRAGMALGVMHDLPVGVSTSGADAWSLQDSYATSVSVGCPPDPFNQIGQDWNQPPWRRIGSPPPRTRPFERRSPPSCGMPAACVSTM